MKLRLNSISKITSFAVSAILLAGCASRPAQPAEPPEIVASSFDATAEGETVHLLYGNAAGEKQVALSYRSWEVPSGKWSKALVVPTDHAVPGNHHRGNDPQIAARDQRLAAVWTARGKGPYGSGPIGVALSDDGGKTWKPGPSPTPPGDAAGYRFPAAAAGKDAFHLIWIHAQGEERSLRYSRLRFGAVAWDPAEVIDPACCACCWNELKIDDAGRVYALYRDALPRDMALAIRESNGEWKHMSHAGEFNWKFDGCPHVGGGLAVHGNQVLASVWSGSDRWLGAYALKSSNNGRTWSKPTRLRAGTEPGRHTDLALLPSGTAAVAWDQISEDQRTVHVRLSHDGGSTWALANSLSPAGTQASHPRLLACRNQFVAFWSEDDASGIQRIRMQTLAQDGREGFKLSAARLNPPGVKTPLPPHNHH